ncbi:MAG TPA: PDZ domain-containing protein [Candidatus Polarisedimenticolaceae bacterium]|nr:PDZ domain-containing protein [Candidatus Polarisedimenticolaceae bacterium]
MRSSLLIAPLAMFALAAPALAGGAECEKAAKNAAYAASHKGCTASKEDCLKHMAEARNNGWLGIEYDHTEDGTTVVKSVVKGSPAEKAGFQSGDVLYAVNGVQFNDANMAQVKAVWKSLKPGSTVNYTVKRSGAPTDLTATLGRMPDAVYDTMVAEHMKEHVAVAAK